MQKGVVSQLYVYPIKSHAATAVKSIALTQQGLYGDRRWMWVDEEGNFLTQRHFPQMCLWKVDISQKRIRFTHQLEQTAVEVLFSEMESRRTNVRVWADQLEAELFSSNSLEQISQSLFGKSAFLAYMPDRNIRSIKHTRDLAPAFTSFADSFPFLIANEASVESINKSFDKPISMLHFRPNIVVSGFPAFAEDNWRSLRIGDCEFLIEKSCGRCSMVNVIPSSGEIRKDVLTALAKTRTENHKVIFGKHALLKGAPSELAVGQRVQVLE